MRRPHQNVATVLVDPVVVRDLELELMALDLWLWPVATSGVSADGARLAFQTRRRMVQAKRGAWDLAAEWLPAFISFGDSWYAGAEPLPWSAHATLWHALARYPDHTRYRLGLGGVPTLQVQRETEV